MNWMARAAMVVAALASGGAAMSFEITSTEFRSGGEIPIRYTCEGEDTSPALAWRDLPAGTRSLVLIVDDPDAPDPAAPKMTWVHWVLFDLPPESRGLPEGAGSGKGLPEGTRVGRNDWKRADYGGPCPPIGRHRYFHKLYALDRRLSLPDQPSKQDVEAAMQGHVLATAELVGTYEKRHR
jgi:Raf kinase inhibitor-like YbhB/YbcL family protein